MRSSSNIVVGPAPPRTRTLPWPRLLVFSIASVLILSLSTAMGWSTAKAEYLKLEIKLEPAKVNVLRRSVRRVLTDPASFRNAEELKNFDSYFLEYHFPAMTQTSPQALGDVGRKRKDLFQALWNRRIHTEAYRHLTKMAFDQMKAIATDNFHPVARYNAVVALGLLDQQPASGTDQPPVPLPEAADVLLGLIQPDAKNVPDAVQIGSLLGLMRHVELGLSAERSDRLRVAALALLNTERPEDRTAEGHAWLETLCAEALAKTGKLGADLNVHKALLAIIGNSNRPLSNRCREMEALARLKPQYTPEAGVDAESTAASLATLVKDVAEAESEEAEEFKERVLRDGATRSDSGEEEKYPRRRLLYRVQCLLDGFDAVDAVLSGDAKPHVQEITDGLTAIKKLASDKESLDLALSSETSGTIGPKIVAAAEALLPSESDDESDSLEGLEIDQ